MTTNEPGPNYREPLTWNSSRMPCILWTNNRQLNSPYLFGDSKPGSAQIYTPKQQIQAAYDAVKENPSENIGSIPEVLEGSRLDLDWSYMLLQPMKHFFIITQKR
jgi:hypothetical protein